MSTTDSEVPGYPVTLASGAPFLVISPVEVQYIEERVNKYTSEFRYENVSDLQDVDQIIIKELFCHRWSLWISRQVDYFGGQIDEQALRRSINDYSSEIRALKKALGMDKVSRDKEHGDESVNNYLSNLKRRAMEFGINRNNMQAKTIELGQQVIALTTLHFNCDDQERIENHATADDVMVWLRDVFTPEFQAVDQAFRDGQQKFWIKDL